MPTKKCVQSINSGECFCLSYFGMIHRLPNQGPTHALHKNTENIGVSAAGASAELLTIPSSSAQNLSKTALAIALLPWPSLGWKKELVDGEVG
jgi:hypothetical protein